MYVPVLHARRAERLAFRPIAQKIAEANNVMPLAIPVRDTPNKRGVGKRNLELFIKEFSDLDLRCFVLTTPYAENVELTQSDILSSVALHDKKKVVTPVVAVTSAKPATELRDEIKALKGVGFALLHVQDPQAYRRTENVLKEFEDKITTHIFYSEDCSELYMDRWQGADRIIIHDGFEKQNRNADYASCGNKLYSKIPYQYQAMGFQGYGDHTIVGEVYKPGGGQPKAVATHLTYHPPVMGRASEIGIRHFVSDSTTETATRTVCTEQAIQKLVDFYMKNQSRFSFSTACREFSSPNMSTSLEVIKRLSIRHHIEMMCHLNL